MVSVNSGQLGSCGATTFTPLRNGSEQVSYTPNPSTHQALYLTDPAGEQTALFDLEWGGALASLKYNGAEQVWGNHPGGMVQPSWFQGSAAFDYNPQLAGSEGAGSGNLGVQSPLLGATCKRDGFIRIVIHSILNDDAPNNQSGRNKATGVRNDALLADSWPQPYAVTTIASFVPSGSAVPQYYLRIEHWFTNVALGQNISFLFSYAEYTIGENKALRRSRWVELS